MWHANHGYPVNPFDASRIIRATGLIGIFEMLVVAPGPAVDR